MNLSNVQVTTTLRRSRGAPVVIEPSATGTPSAATDLAAALTSTELLDAAASTLAVGRPDHQSGGARYPGRGSVRRRVREQCTGNRRQLLRRPR